jgi:hypothetical protein
MFPPFSANSIRTVQSKKKGSVWIIVGNCQNNLNVPLGLSKKSDGYSSCYLCETGKLRTCFGDHPAELSNSKYINYFF